MLPSITFLSPVFLVGVLAAAIPLIIHLSRSRRTKTLRFSTTRFFTDEFLRSYRMSRLKELLLLAFRMALCGLLAVALARPLYLPRGGLTLPGGARAVVFVLDNSASMGYVEDGLTMLDRARGAAREVISGLGANDTASVVLAGRRAEGPEVLFPQTTPALGDVAQAVDGVTVAALGTDLAGAVRRAEEILARTQAASKEIYVLSDLQESGWEPLDDDAAGRGADTLYFFVQTRPKAVSNLGVTAVQYASPRPMVGVPFTIRAHMVGQGEQARETSVRLVIDGQKVSERRLEKLADGRWAVPRFVYTFPKGGWHTGYVEVDDEAFLLDNRRYFALEVLDTVQVLAVNGAPSKVPHQDELLYLKFALTGGQEADQGPIKLKEIAPSELANTDLALYPLVILANVAALSDAAVEKLEAFVDRGGSLLLFLGDKANAAFYNRNLAGANRLHGGLLPGRLLQVEGGAGGAEPLATVAAGGPDASPLEALQDARIDLTRVTFRALWKVESAGAAVLMRASTGAPLLCEKAFGKGRVLLFTSTCNRRWTNFPTRPAFLPWIYQLVAYLVQDPLVPQAFHVTGDAVSVPVSAAEGIPQVQVKKPDGTVGRVTLNGQDPDRPVVFTDTTQPGIYTLLGDKADKAPQLAVNLDAYESRLTYLDDAFSGQDRAATDRSERIEAGLKEYLPGRPLVNYVADSSGIGEASLAARRGFKLWDVVLVIVLAIALFEPWLANRISLRHYARPKEGERGVLTPRWDQGVNTPRSLRQEVRS
jgi:hypothetical protein